MGIKEVIELAKARERRFISDETFCVKVCSEIINLKPEERIQLSQIISSGADVEGEG